MESRLVAVNDCCLYNQAMRNPSALRTLSSQTDETVEHRHVQQSPYTIRYRMGRYQATIFCHLNISLQPYKYFSNYDVKLSCQIEGPSETIIHLSFNNRKKIYSSYIPWQIYLFLQTQSHFWIRWQKQRRMSGNLSFLIAVSLWKPSKRKWIHF